MSSYKGQWQPGAHDPLVSEEIFNLVQTILKKNSGRSETLQIRPERDYPLCVLRLAHVGPDLS